MIVWSKLVLNLTLCAGKLQKCVTWVVISRCVSLLKPCYQKRPPLFLYLVKLSPFSLPCLVIYCGLALSPIFQDPADVVMTDLLKIISDISLNQMILLSLLSVLLVIRAIYLGIPPVWCRLIKPVCGLYGCLYQPKTVITATNKPHFMIEPKKNCLIILPFQDGQASFRQE